MMGLIEKAANTIYQQHGWFTSDGLLDAQCGSYGTKDQHLFERLGDLKTLNHGVPDPKLHTITRTPRWGVVKVMRFKAMTRYAGGPPRLA